MKKLLIPLCLLLLLGGCKERDGALERAIALRQDLLNAESCSFDCRITADYGDSLHKFSVSCQGDSQGNLRFRVTEPETIGGITGRVREDGGKLTFGDTALHFPLLTDRQLSPVSGPWIFLRTLRSGYLQNAGPEGDLLHVGAGDSYEEGALLVDFWLNGDNQPKKAEILYNNRKILTLEIENFTMTGKGNV